MEPFFSIILPIYNVASYLDRCFCSILQQNFFDYEIIAVDDGSTDESLEICKHYKEQYSCITLIHKSNGGLSSARNAGLEIAKGKYVFMIDSDDWIEKDALSQLYMLTKEDLPDIVKFNYIKRPSNTKVSSILNIGLKNKIEIREKIISVALRQTGKVILSAWCHIYKNEFLKNDHLRFVSERVIGSEDYLFNLQAYSKADSLLVIDNYIYNYDLREGSLTNRYRCNIFEQYNELHKQFELCLDSNNLLDDQRMRDLAYSYIEKMIGVCMKNECVITNDHSSIDAIKNCKTMVKSKMFEKFYLLYPIEDIGTKRKILLWTMKRKWVLPTIILLSRGLKREKK